MVTFAQDLLLCCFVCPCLIPEVLPSILGNGTLLPSSPPFSSTVECSWPSAHGIVKNGFPGWSSLVLCWQPFGIFYVRANNGDNGGSPCCILPLHCPDGHCPIQPIPFKRIQFPAQTLFLSSPFFCIHTPVGLEPSVSVSALPLFPPTLILYLVTLPIPPVPAPS